MQRDASAGIPTVVFGAFDRHNFGDLLFPHVMARMLPGSDLLFAGLAERDLRAQGGHQIRALPEVAASLRDRPVNVIHTGGELLTCDAWEAAVMLSQPEEMQEAMASLADWRQGTLSWARARLGVAAWAPYTLARESFPHVVHMFFNAVGGVDLDERDPAMRAEVLAKLKAADDISTRDRQTKALLDASGLATRLIPDPAVMVAELFGKRIRQHSAHSTISRILDAFPERYMAVQFSADFGDDETLCEIAAQLDRIAASSGLGVVFFRAGAAPWHDDLKCYRRVLARMRVPSVKIFSSLNIWYICALIAHSRVYCGSSLHGRIVAMAFALPRVNLCHPARTSHSTKQTAFATTWEEAGVPTVVDVPKMAEGICDALAVDRAHLQHTAEELVTRYRQGFEPVRAKLWSTAAP
jgi:hypothetical protein